MLRILGNAFAIPEIRQEDRLHGGDAGALPARRLHPGAGRRVERDRGLQNNFAGSDILGFLNLFSGGGLSRLSLFALGIMPYITASIILQLLTVVVPALEKLQKEGEVGQQKITQYTRYLTVGSAFGSRSATSSCSAPPGPPATSVVGELTFAKLMLVVISLTAGPCC